MPVPGLSKTPYSEFMRILVALLLLAPYSAHALDLTFLGGYTYAAPTEKAGNNYPHWTGKSGFSFGASIAFNLLDSSFDLESGVFSIKAKSEQGSGAFRIERTFDSILIPLLIRYHFDRAASLALGAYTAASSDLPSDDRGLLLSIAARLHLTSHFYLVLDARYQHGLANLASVSGDYLNTRSIQGFAGVSVDLTGFKEARANPESP